MLFNNILRYIVYVIIYLRMFNIHNILLSSKEIVLLYIIRTIINNNLFKDFKNNEIKYYVI